MKHHIIIAVIFACLLSACENSPTSTAGTTKSQYQVTVTPTKTLPHRATPAPVKTPAPRIPYATNGSATLGGTLDAFEKVWGTPTGGVDIGIVDFPIPFNCGSFCTSLFFEHGTNRLDYVYDIFLGGPSNGWSLSQAHDYCRSFAPFDKAYRQTYTITQGLYISAYDEVYFSQSLALIFPSSDFDDANVNPTTPGLFEIDYSVATDNTVVSCELQIGTQNTQG